MPDGLRAAGLTIVTMREYYGEAAGAQVADVDWIAMAAQQDWVMFHKDANIRRRADERQAVADHGGRMFCITNASITGAQMLERYLTSLAAISRAASRPGPYIYGVDEKKINRLYP